MNTLYSKLVSLELTRQLMSMSLFSINSNSTHLALKKQVI